MTDQPIPLDYARPQTRQWPEWLVLLGRLCWVWIVVSIYSNAAICPLFIVLGIINLSHPIEGLEMFGKPVTTMPQKVEWIVINVLMAGVFIPLAIWHARRLWRRHQRSTAS